MIHNLLLNNNVRDITFNNTLEFIIYSLAAISNEIFVIGGECNYLASYYICKNNKNFLYKKANKDNKNYIIIDIVPLNLNYKDRIELHNYYDNYSYNVSESLNNIQDEMLFITLEIFVSKETKNKFSFIN